jgi:hypothetical protein
MYVSEGAAGRLEPQTHRDVTTSITISERKFWLVPDDGGSAAERLTPGEDWHAAPLSFQIATYAYAMERVRKRMEAAFGPCQILVSENSQLPFSPDV